MWIIERVKQAIDLVFLWSRLGESNPRPTHYENCRPRARDRHVGHRRSSATRADAPPVSLEPVGGHEGGHGTTGPGSSPSSTLELPAQVRRTPGGIAVDLARQDRIQERARQRRGRAEGAMVTALHNVASDLGIVGSPSIWTVPVRNLRERAVRALGVDGYAKCACVNMLGSSDDYQIHEITNAAGWQACRSVELEGCAELVGDMVCDRIDPVSRTLESGELDRRLGLPRLGITRDHCVEHDVHNELTNQPDADIGIDLHSRQLTPRLARALIGTTRCPTYGGW